MRNFQYSFYRVPQSPLARLGLVLAGIAILAVSFFVGLVFLAVAAGAAIIGALVLGIRNWLGLGNSRRRDDTIVDVEYRVVDRTRRGRD